MPELIILALLGFIPLTIGFWIWMLVDCICNEPAEDKNKMTWVIVICVASVLGAFIYFFARRPTRKKLYGR